LYGAWSAIAMKVLDVVATLEDLPAARLGKGRLAPSSMN